MKTKLKSKSGRHPLPVDIRKLRTINIRITQEFYDTIKAESLETGVPMTRRIILDMIAGMASRRKVIDFNVK
jgi:hypothetical protein